MRGKGVANNDCDTSKNGRNSSAIRNGFVPSKLAARFSEQGKKYLGIIVFHLMESSCVQWPLLM